MASLSVPDKHQLKIARQTLRMSCEGAFIMGGMDHPTAVQVIRRLTGGKCQQPKHCNCADR
jgi:hypothetical protein